MNIKLYTEALKKKLLYATGIVLMKKLLWK